MPYPNKEHFLKQNKNHLEGPHYIPIHAMYHTNYAKIIIYTSLILAVVNMET